MKSTPRYSQLALTGAVVLALGLASGCSWFKHKSDYQKSVENSPLEVPPDLTMPDTSAATQLPPTSSLGTPASTSVTAGVLVDGDAKSVWTKLGDLLAGLNGVTVQGKAEALNSYDVSYKGQSFLVRVEDANGQSRISAISADGQVLNGGAAGELLRAVKERM